MLNDNKKLQNEDLSEEKQKPRKFTPEELERVSA